MKDRVGENLEHGGAFGQDHQYHGGHIGRVFGHGYQYHGGHIGQIGQNETDLSKGTEASRAKLMVVGTAAVCDVSVLVPAGGSVDNPVHVSLQPEH